MGEIDPTRLSVRPWSVVQQISITYYKNHLSNFVYLLAVLSFVLTWCGIKGSYSFNLAYFKASLFSSVFSDNLIALNVILYYTFACFDWFATLNLKYTYPEESVLNKCLLIGPFWSSSSSREVFIMSSRFFTFIIPPRKNYETRESWSKLGFQHLQLTSCLPGVTGISTKPYPCMNTLSQESFSKTSKTILGEDIFLTLSSTMNCQSTGKEK